MECQADANVGARVDCRGPAAFLINDGTMPWGDIEAESFLRVPIEKTSTPATRSSPLMNAASVAGSTPCPLGSGFALMAAYTAMPQRSWLCTRLIFSVRTLSLLPAVHLSPQPNHPCRPLSDSPDA